MTTPVTAVYLDDDGHRTAVFVRPDPDLDTLGNVYLEIVDETNADQRIGAFVRRVRIPLHLADEFEAAWREAREQLESVLPDEDLAEEEGSTDA